MGFSTSRIGIGFNCSLPIAGDFLKETGSASEQIASEKKELDQATLDKFKNDLAYIYFSSDADTQKIIKKLLKITPKNIELQQVVDLIFEQAATDYISPLIDAILLTHPEFTLSPLNQIRRAITEDEEYQLTTSSLNTMFSEYELTTDEEKIAACYNLAYRMNHPGIYLSSPISVPSSDYTLNFIWINLNPQDRVQNFAENIFGNGLNLGENADCIKDPYELRRLEKDEQSSEEDVLKKWHDTKKSFTYRISQWADINPNAQINLWYDSALVTAKAQQKTFEMMRAISESRRVNLQLKDIRRLPNIEGEIEHSLHPGTPLYYRVDILKALIADHMIGSPEEGSKYCIVSDIDVEPMTPDQLFDQRTLGYLSSNGYVFNKEGLNNFENSFFIFNKEKADLKENHRNSLIDHTAAIITMLRRYSFDIVLKDEFVLNSHFVFRQYHNFRKQMNESFDYSLQPRKIVKCPKSQFNFGGNFCKFDYQQESFRFLGDKKIPYTTNGRACNRYDSEGYIKELANWIANPLDSPQ